MTSSHLVVVVVFVHTVSLMVMLLLHSFQTSVPPRPGRNVFICCFYDIATVFQLYHGGGMMYEMRRKPEHTLLATLGIFNI